VCAQTVVREGRALPKTELLKAFVGVDLGPVASPKCKRQSGLDSQHEQSESRPHLRWWHVHPDDETDVYDLPTFVKTSSDARGQECSITGVVRI
jgi:hypothetical protein